MKKIYLISTEPWVYLTEIPIIAMLMVAIRYNDDATNDLKFYPLILFLLSFALFIVVFFFRVVALDMKSIEYIGPFSSKDNAEIKEKRTLVLTIANKTKTKIELFADAAEEATFDWMKADDVIHREICIFRGKILGKSTSAKQVLKYFNIPTTLINNVLCKDSEFENDFLKLTSVHTPEKKEIKIHFLKTYIEEDVINEH